MQLGCNTVLFSMVDLAAALTHIAWAGYQHVELAAIAGMCEHVSPTLDPAGVREVRRMLADHGLEATAMEAATTDRARLEALFGLAGDLGVPIVNIGSGGVTGDEESTGQAIAHIGELARLAGRYGVRLAVKPHVGQAIYNGMTALRLMKELSLTSAYGERAELSLTSACGERAELSLTSACGERAELSLTSACGGDAVREPALGLNFDPSHLFRAGEEPPEVARRWGAHIITAHVRDCPHRGQGPGRPEEQIPGRGIVDIPATLRALDAVGYAGPLNLEVIGAREYELSRAMGIAAEARGYLHRCLQELSAVSHQPSASG